MKRIRLCCTWGANPNKQNGFKDIANFEKCQFAIEASLQNDFIVIGQCSLEHNHELKRENTRHMVSHRMFDEYFKRQALLNDAVGISIANNFQILAREAGGHENLHINQRDIRNFLNQEQRRSRINGDAAALEAQFIKLKEVDPDFYNAMETDFEGKLLNVFWADGRYRGMTKAFGDAISYDATFCVNRYKIPFTPFVGVNHHGSTIVLAAALVSHEDAESFTWIFRKWYQEIIVDLWKIIDDSADSDDFEEAWHHFVTNYQNALRSTVEDELKFNFACDERPSPYNKTIIAEEVFQRAYTNNMFREVKDEVNGLIHTKAESHLNIGNLSSFNVTDEVTTPFWNRREKRYNVTVNLDFGEFNCTCKLFEFQGILCRYIIRVLQLKKVQFIPDKYILNRWRKDLVRGYEHLPVGYYNHGESERLKRSLAVTMKKDYIYRLTLHDDEMYALYEAESAKVVKALAAHVGIETLNEMGAGSDVTRVWGRKRLQPKENNLRHMVRNVPPPTEGALRDPVDKRGAGRGSRPRQKKVRRAVNFDETGPLQQTPR
ncbi:protein FAR1-RELATED SEQUENCE 5-like [Silene latifolia]|uniref:protein FAR1-RELATED SEQUENCE 5-like n=1 Tax=Silene latifolia TaxID=37657 RepID=UPI003D7834E6